MSLLGRCFVFFPAIHFTLIVFSVIFLIRDPKLISLCSVIFSIYLFAPILFRFHNFVYPLQEGESSFDTKDYHPWWGVYQLQYLYIGVPLFESILRLFPGCFSAWLRLWGSNIGHKVIWTPKIEILDRTGLDIGNGAIFGHDITVCSHHIKNTQKGLILYYRRIRIGEGAFIGAASRMAAGVTIEDKVKLHACNDVYPDVRVTKDHPRKEKQTIMHSDPYLAEIQ